MSREKTSDGCGWSTRQANLLIVIFDKEVRATVIALIGEIKQ
jgi:hypothetical protein